MFQLDYFSSQQRSRTLAQILRDTIAGVGLIAFGLISFAFSLTLEVGDSEDELELVSRGFHRIFRRHNRAE